MEAKEWTRLEVWVWQIECLLVTALLLLVLLTAHWGTLSCLMYLQPRPRLLGVPLEAFQVWCVKLIVSLALSAMVGEERV